MKVRAIVLAIVAMFATSALASAQQPTGEIFGKVTDQSGAVMPGVTVTLTSPILLQPLTAVTSETGTYQFPRLEVADYSVKFELSGFKTVVNEGVHITAGFSAQINAQLGVSTVQETITVTGASPIIDTKDTGTKSTFTQELLQSIPSARDPWVIIQQTAGVAMDRENIGGNQSGQQSNYVSRGAGTFNTKWTMDGVDVTDMNATGGSSSYYDFDSFEEMTIQTGGVDVTQQTGGVGIQLITKSGSDKFRGQGRYFVTDDKFESQNVTDAQRTQGATSGNPIQNIKDMGFQLGGPLVKGRAWIFGAVGKQLVDVGVLGFYQPSANCQALKTTSVALATPIADVNNCLNTDETLLQQLTLKAEVQLFKGNKLSLFNNLAKKERNARGADDLHPIETTARQAAVPSTFGKNFWTTGPNPLYKFGDQWVVSDRFLVDVQYTHLGNNFVLDVHSPELLDVQPTLIIPSGLNGRSATQQVFLRPDNGVNVNANYFAPGLMGSDHAFKLGGYWRDAYSSSYSHTGGYATVRFPSDAALANDDCATVAKGCQVDLTRDGLSVYDTPDIALYAQDSITHNRLTLQLGIRYDRMSDKALAASIAANPLSTQWLPAIAFNGADPGITWNTFSPRLGMTYDIKGDGKTIARANYARYYSQLGNGNIAGTINPVGSTTLRYPWTDLNGDRVAQANEILTSANPLSASTNWSSANPANTVSANSVDPNLKDDTTDEIILGFDHELGAGFAVGGNYIWRRYSGFQWSDRQGLSTSDYTAATFTPTAASCPASQNANCPTVTYYQPLFQIPTIVTLTNVPGAYNLYNGVELTGRKRMSNHWMMNTSFSYNDAVRHFDSFPGSISSTSQSSTAFVEDPTNRSARDGAQLEVPTSGSGIGNVYINSKWLYKLSGLYNLPYDINVSAFFNARQGFPIENVISGPSRINGAGIPLIFLDPIGSVRLPNYANLDFHLDRPIRIGSAKFVPSLDVFNVTNSNTVQAVRGTQNASNANNIQAIVAPRVARFGIRVNW
ncbi:MAG TPA: TonB-dependent receptor [Vicinamibacterales bacterium]|nr:TonB-dependent receptor [Vicinamibacterales bacterium]